MFFRLDERLTQLTSVQYLVLTEVRWIMKKNKIRFLMNWRRNKTTSVYNMYVPHSLTDSLTHSLTHSLTYLVIVLTSSFWTRMEESSVATLNNLLTKLFAKKESEMYLTRSVNYLITHLLTNSLTRLLNYLLTQVSRTSTIRRVRTRWLHQNSDQTHGFINGENQLTGQ